MAELVRLPAQPFAVPGLSLAFLAFSRVPVAPVIVDVGLPAESGKETGSEDEGQGPLGLPALEAVVCILPRQTSPGI